MYEVKGKVCTKQILGSLWKMVENKFLRRNGGMPPLFVAAIIRYVAKVYI